MQRQFSGERRIFSTSGAGKSVLPQRQSEPRHHTQINNKLRMDRRPKCKRQHYRRILPFRFETINFYVMTAKAQSRKGPKKFYRKINLIKTKKCLLRERYC